MLNETRDMAFKAYLTGKIQGWFRRWGRNEPAAPPPSLGASAGVAGAATPVRPPSDVDDVDEDGGGLGGGPPAED